MRRRTDNNWIVESNELIIILMFLLAREEASGFESGWRGEAGSCAGLEVRCTDRFGKNQVIMRH